MSCLWNRLLISVLLVVVAASSAMAIHCWDCSSHINPGCGDPFYNNSFAMVDCDQQVRPHLQEQATFCRKIVQKVEGDARLRVIRGCGWIVDESVNKACIRRSGTFSVTVEYCSCDSEGCNAAFSTMTAASQVELVVKLSLGLLFSYYCLQRQRMSIFQLL